MDSYKVNCSILLQLLFKIETWWNTW